MDSIALMKRAAATEAVRMVRDGDVIGLGSGSTARLAITALGERVQDGLRVIGIPTSEESARLAQRHGIRLASLAEYSETDLTIDGADEIDPRLNLIKGLGGALVREKVVAAVSRRLVIVADAGKLVERLGDRSALPVAVVPFAWPAAALAITRLGGSSSLRLRASATGVNAAEPLVTDDGLNVLDCRFPSLADASALERTLRDLVGVVATGLFLGMADLALVGMPDGSVKRLDGGRS